ncbi:aldo/keto reductase [Formosa sediminum]|uniref:Aldo/keto reductase n=1 Tax=Formosa sediminum TaxID=2594004 RepID=A0A516GTA9_9FLAO|nr:aldo/keto reductase [Formosa sediminum]QDO94754.1 aldo/keto reductase [Formosa sediminum]
MEYRTLGTSDLKLSAITFGAWAAGGWMWGGTEQNDAAKAIQSAFDYGVTSIDTAPIYGMGHSEKIVGEAIKELPRDQVQLVTKYGLRWDATDGEFYVNSKDNNGKDISIYKNASKKSIIKECEDSLKRLGTDYIDLYQIHWPDVTTEIQESMEAVAQLIKDGKVRYAGVCNYSVDQLKEANTYVDVISNQVPYSMVNRGIETDLVPYTLEHNMSILAYSPLQRGLLTGKMKAGHVFAEGDHRKGLAFFKDENIKQTAEFLDKLKPLAEAKNASLSQLVLRWTIEQPGITIALAGARNAEQSISNAKSIDVKLTTDELQFINKALEKVKLDV